jgi:hypothetical protein
MIEFIITFRQWNKILKNFTVLIYLDIDKYEYYITHGFTKYVSTYMNRDLLMLQQMYVQGKDLEYHKIVNSVRLLHRG